MKTAEYWEATEGGVKCALCPHGCKVREGELGLCGARGCRDGRLVALTYGRVSSAHVDPIEKKPLYHFHPGDSVFSIGGWGCNLKCRFCQNWTISQRVATGGRAFSAEHVAAEAVARGSVGVAYTYNEPGIGFEYVRDCCRRVRAAGLRNVLVTNGYLRTEPAAELLAVTDAVNLDIKSMRDAFYREFCSARVAPVLAFAKQAVAAGVHIEITNLLIPTLNDGESELETLAEWIGNELGDRVPLHFSAYHPEFRMAIPATPVATLASAHAIAVRHLKYVYLGNVRSGVGRDTTCPTCGKVLVDRRDYVGRRVGIKGDRCAACGAKADFVLS